MAQETDEDRKAGEDGSYRTALAMETDEERKARLMEMDEERKAILKKMVATTQLKVNPGDRGRKKS